MTRELWGAAVLRKRVTNAKTGGLTEDVVEGLVRSGHCRSRAVSVLSGVVEQNAQGGEFDALTSMIVRSSRPVPGLAHLLSRAKTRTRTSGRRHRSASWLCGRDVRCGGCTMRPLTLPPGFPACR